MSERAAVPDPLPAAPRATIGRGGATGVGLASLASAGVGYIVLAVAARVLLPTEVNSVFVTFWATLFACFGVLSGLSIETTRAVAAATGGLAIGGTSRAAGTRPHPRVLTVGAASGLLTGAAIAASAPLWADRVFATDGPALAGLVAFGVLAYAAHSTVIGALAGQRMWSPYSWLIGAESTVRLVLVGVAALAGYRVLGFAAGTAAAAATWVGLLALSPRARRAALARADVPAGAFARRVVAASVATGASALLMVGFPVLLSVTTSPAEYAAATPLLIALAWTRAPLMIPLNAYQGVAVSHFVQHQDRGLRALLPAARAVLAVGAVGSVLAALVGPWLMTSILGPDYRVSGLLLAGLTAASTGLALLTLTGALCQAMTMHRAFVGGWLVALGVAFIALWLPGDLPTRTVVALVLGPGAGIAVHLGALRHARRAHRSGRAANA